MLFYQLAVSKVIKYFRLDELFKKDETLLILLKKKKKVDPKIELKIDKTLNFYISILLTIIAPLITLTIPFAGLEYPCDCFIEEKMYVAYEVCQYVNDYFILLDLLIIFLIITVIKVTKDMLADAIEKTDINISPWVLRGKYKIEPHIKAICHWCLKKKYKDIYDYAEYFPEVAREIQRFEEYQKILYKRQQDELLKQEQLKELENSKKRYFGLF